MHEARAKRRSGTPRRQFARALLAAAFGAVSLLGIAPQAHADDVTDLQSRARQIAERLDQLQRQEAQLAEQFDATQIKSQAIDDQIVNTRQRLKRADALVARRRRQLARYSLRAYVGSGDDDFTAMLEGRQALSLRRDGYTDLAVGDRQQLVDEYQAARQIGDESLRDLRRSQHEQVRVRADLAQKQQDADALLQQQQKLQAQVQGKLAVAVAAQQKRLAAEAAAAAEAKWRASQGGSAAGGTDGGGPTSTPVTTTTVAGSTTVPGTTVPGSPSTTVPPTTAPPVTLPPAPPPSPPTDVPPSPGGPTAAAAAQSQIGVPYSWGGGNASGPSYGFGTGAKTKGFDCSGLTLYAWAQAGVYLYHNAQMQYDSIRHVAMSQLQVGDLVFYGSSSRAIDHVSIYIGGGQVVHAPHTGSTVQTGPVYLWGGYFAWVGAGRPG